MAGYVDILGLPSPPPAEAKGPNIKNNFTPVPNMFEMYNRMDQFIISSSKNSGTKGTFCKGRKYNFGYNRKSTDWKASD